MGDYDKQTTEPQLGDQQADPTKTTTGQQGGEASGDSWKSDSADQQTGQGDYGSAEQADTLTQGRTGTDDATSQQDGQPDGFVGSRADDEDSDDLIDREQPIEGQ